MKLATPKTELPPSIQLRKTVFGALAICAVTVLSSLIATPAEAGPEVNPAAREQSATEYKLKIPFGLEETAVVIPADNPLTNEKIELGRMLFFDKRLSQDNTIACES